MAKINVLNKEITLYTRDEEDYICITDIAKYKNAETTGLIISHWLSTRFTVEFMGFWEKIHNPDFNVTEFSNIKNQSGSNGFVLTVKQWVQKTNAIGIISKPGRYGGTYAHKDIAFEFASWISAEFKLYLIKEFQRLKNFQVIYNRALYKSFELIYDVFAPKKTFSQRTNPSCAFWQS